MQFIVTIIIFNKEIPTFKITELGTTPLVLMNCIDVVPKESPMNL